MDSMQIIDPNLIEMEKSRVSPSQVQSFVTTSCICPNYVSIFDRDSLLHPYPP